MEIFGVSKVVHFSKHIAFYILEPVVSLQSGEPVKIIALRSLKMHSTWQS